MRELEYFRPATLEEATALLHRYGSRARVLAGGTDLLVGLRDGTISCACVVDVKAIPEMRQLSFRPASGLFIGGAVTVNRLIRDPEVGRHYPVLVQAGRSLANALVRNRATVVGNLCNASPAADMAPALLVLGASLRVADNGGTRTVPLAGFFTGPKKHVLRPEELVVGVEVPPVEGRAVYLKKARIKGFDLAQVGVAGLFSPATGLRLGLGAVAPTPVLVSVPGIAGREQLGAEDVQAAVLEKVFSSIDPISDQRASREYRLAMVEYLVKRVLAHLGEAGEHAQAD